MADLPDPFWVAIVTGIAAGLTLISYVPQALKTIRTKSTTDISLTFYIMQNIGMLFWLYIGLMYQNWVMVACDIVIIGLTLTILRLKLKYG